MKFTVATVAAIVALVQAQGISDIPSCALTACLLPAVGKAAPECGLTDFPCICKHKAELTAEVKPCVEKACTDPADVEKTIKVTDALCGGSDKPSSSAAPTESKPAESSSAAPTETQPTISETSAPATETTPAGTDCPTTMVPTTTAAGNTTAPTTVPITAGAAGMGSVGAMVAMALGALAL